MAIELCNKSNWASSWPPPLPPAAVASSAVSVSHSTAIGSPRLSFSRDVNQSESGGGVDERLDGALDLDSPAASDFNFCVAGDGLSELESSTADQLFHNGKLLPLPLLLKSTVSPKMEDPGCILPPKTRDATPATNSASPPARTISRHGGDGKGRLKEIIACPDEDNENEKATSRSKLSSIWKLGRSASLNFGGSSSSSNGGGHSHMTGLICYLNLLPRSKSSGFDPNPNRKSQRQTSIGRSSGKSSSCGSLDAESRLFRKPSKGSSSSSSSSSSLASYYYGGPSRSNSRGVRISPVLNVPPPCIPKGSGGNGFFEYLLCSGKDKSSSRKKSQFLFTSQSP